MVKLGAGSTLTLRSTAWLDVVTCAGILSVWTVVWRVMVPCSLMRTLSY